MATYETPTAGFEMNHVSGKAEPAVLKEHKGDSDTPAERVILTAEDVSTGMMTVLTDRIEESAERPTSASSPFYAGSISTRFLTKPSSALETFMD